MQKNKLKEEAKLAGLVKYFDSKPCKYGHVGERYTRSGSCVTCDLARKPDPETIQKAQAKYKAKNRELLNKKAKERRDKNPELYNERTRVWRENNPEKIKAYTKANLARQAASTKKRRTLLIQRMPKWADEKAILMFYEEAARLTRETGIQYNVDHYYPLQGDTVSGLHVHFNLQIITQHENYCKSNKHPDDFYGKQIPREDCSTSDAKGPEANKASQG